MKFSVSAMPAGVKLPFNHKHKQNEEVYIFLKGEDKLNVIINNHSAQGRRDLQIDSKTRRLALEFKFANKIISESENKY